jgi:hypothetical protein
MCPIVIRTRVPVKPADARDVSLKQRAGDLEPTFPRIVATFLSVRLRERLGPRRLSLTNQSDPE